MQELETGDVIGWIVDVLSGAQNVSREKLLKIFGQTLDAVRKSTRVECWLLVKDGQPLDSSFGGISAIDGHDDGLYEDIYEREIWVSMNDCAIDNADKFPPGVVRANFVASDFVHQEGQISHPEAGWDFPPYWEHAIELVDFKQIGND